MSSHPSPTSSPANTLLRGRAAVLSSSESLICAFMFFYRKDPASLIDWTLGQQAFNSCMILLFDAIELNRITTAVAKVEQVYVIFKELSDNRVHKIADLAVERISWGLAELHRISTQTTSDGIEGRQYTQDFRAGYMAQNEATSRGETYDTVMGNTGMMLLEDPGLQAFHHEPFSPVQWNAPRPNTKVPMNEERQSSQMFHETATASGSNLQHVRSTLNLQGTRRSPTVRSAPTRYATPTEEDPRSHGSTAPTSPLGYTSAQRPGRETITNTQTDLQTSQEYQRMRPPHLSHTQLHPGQRLMPAYRYQGANMQSRHNSCPSLSHEIMNSAPLLRPTYSSPSNSTPSTNFATGLHTQPDARIPRTVTTEDASLYAYLDTAQHPDDDSATARVRPSSAARTATSMTSTMESMTDFSSLSDRAFEAPVQTQDTVHQQQMSAYLESMPVQYSNTNMTSSTMSYSSDRLYSDDWRGYVGSSEPG